MNCILVNMHIVAYLAISIFSSIPLGGSLSLQATVTLECDLSHGLLQMLNKHEPNPLLLHLLGVKVCIYKNSKSTYNQNLF